MSQERVEGTSNTPKSLGNYQVPNIDSSVTRAANVAAPKVRVVHGANERPFDLDGKTVGSVRKSLRDVFSIPSDAEALIAGKSVGDDFVLEGGQVLEFIKESGVKGA